MSELKDAAANMEKEAETTTVNGIDAAKKDEPSKEKTLYFRKEYGDGDA